MPYNTCDTPSLLLAEVERHRHVLFTQESTPSQLKAWISQDPQEHEAQEYEIKAETPPREAPEYLLQSIQKLEDFFKKKRVRKTLRAQTVVFLITQKNTWSRLQTSFDIFSRLAEAFNMPTAFFEPLSTFGHRTNDTDGVFQSCFSSFQELSLCVTPNLQDQLDICYNMRYVELNNRGGKSPWSCRNFGVLHSLRPSSGESSWLLISVPPSVRARLKDQINGDIHVQVLWHAHLFGAMLHNWRFYINFLAEQYREISASVDISSLSVKSKMGITFETTTSEALRSIYKEVHKALCILRSYGNVSQGILTHTRGLRKRKLIRQEDVVAMTTALRRLTETTQIHMCQLDGLLKSCELTAQAIFQLQNSQSIGTVQDRLQNMEKNLGDAAVQQQYLVSLIRGLSEDSGVTRAVTVVSLAYASAGLIAALFDSSLVEPSSPVTAFSINKDMWIFVLAALSFTFLTMLGVWGLDRSQRRKIRAIK
ncbi:hypothetical protein QBC38DRAFT_34163 [Podospora fimiseda]|uniref:CorA-like transporter domain-containing protein n=1 Tax=Podospora fimiseda TaxID=252190 RepID=A0AAN7BIM4_9PEZI|nr:hypothetical protein QBC38DRAFT_34163 [Podospora fimiseda]